MGGVHVRTVYAIIIIIEADNYNYTHMSTVDVTNFRLWSGNSDQGGLTFIGDLDLWKRLEATQRTRFDFVFIS